MKKYLNNPLLHLVIGIVMLLLLQFKADLFSIHSFHPEQFNTILNEKEAFADQLLTKIENTSNRDTLYKKSGRYNAIYKEKGIAFFVFDGDQQTFWTNRSILFSDGLQEFEKDNGLVLLRNGWYQYIKRQKGRSTYLALILIKHQFNINNKYLKNHFHSSYHTPNNVEIASQGSYPIQSINGETLFYFQKDISGGSHYPTNWVMVFFFFMAYCLIVSFLSKQTQKIKWLKKFSALIVMAFVVASKWVLINFRYPIALFRQELFSPDIYAHSALLPSLGDFLMTTLFFAILVYYFPKWIRHSFYNNKYIALLCILFSAITPLIIADWLEGLIKDSKINFDVNYLLDLSPYSFVGILGVLVLFVTLIVLTKSIFNLFSDKAFKRNHLQNIYGAAGIIAIVIGHFFFQITALLSLWFLAIIIIFSIQITSKVVFYRGVFLTLIISLTVSYGFIHFGKQKEHLTKTFWVKKIAKEKDPVAEYLFKDIKSRIEKDTVIINRIGSYWEGIDDYIKDKYFGGFWNKYDIGIYPCLENDTILIRDENRSVYCLDFFNDKIENEADEPFQISDDINFLYSADGISSYLGKILMKNVKGLHPNSTSYLFMEFYPKTFSKSEGYPELLLNQKEISRTIDLNKYSFAKYKKSKLFTNSGAFNYSTELNQQFHFDENGFASYSYQGFSHIVYQPDKFTTVILSSPKKTIFNYSTVFSYLFIFTGLVVLFVGIFLQIDPFRWQIAFTDFSIKIQLFIVASIFLSFLLFAWGTSYYIKKQYLIKNRKNIAEKVQSVLIELEHKLGDRDELSDSLYDDMTYYLIKFSNVFYTDINLYDKKGELLASSRPEVFETGLTSKRMNIEAYNQIHIYKKSNFIHSEQIGRLNYLSAYVPFKNDNNQVLAYMNLPYFAKQNELENELSVFFTALINIYGLLFLISAIIAIFFANYISGPVRMIRDKIAALQLDKSYELIDWESNDEIGSLVSEYNKKVLELEKNAIMLAKSERESAWREMAKQVAHEIKNPLTPMKLSIQHLQRSAKDSSSDLNDRIERTAQTLIEQIDTLTNIADEFSNFAKMPKANEEVIDLLPIIATTIDLYKEDKHQLLIEEEQITAYSYCG